MRGIDHLVAAGHDLEAMRRRYAALGFTLTPQGRHPFGTANSLAQFKSRCFIELLAVAAPAEIPEHGPEHFSFAAFNRDFLAGGEGLSMLVMDSADAVGDTSRFRAAGIGPFAPFHFSRVVKLPGGAEATVGFSLAFARAAGVRDAGFFVCQQHAPQHFWKADYQTHANGAETISRVILVAERPAEMAPFLTQFTGFDAAADGNGVHFASSRGTVSVLTPAAYFQTYRMTPPDLGHGPRFAGYCVATGDLDAVRSCAAAAGVPLVGRGGRLMVPPEFTFGAMIAFEAPHG